MIPRVPPAISPKAWQRIIRERHLEEDPRPPLLSTDGCHVEEIARAEAEPFILRYEWLGTMGRSSIAYHPVLAQRMPVTPAHSLTDIEPVAGLVHSADLARLRIGVGVEDAEPPILGRQFDRTGDQEAGRIGRRPVTTRTTLQADGQIAILLPADVAGPNARSTSRTRPRRSARRPAPASP